MTASTRRRLRVLGGIGLMALFVAVALLVVVRQAGGWGVPYFSFVSANGSSCRNDLTGHTCTPITLADVELFGDVDLPDSTRVVTGTYRTTHDYALDARLEVPAAAADEALDALRDSFGRCLPRRASGLAAEGLSAVCVQTDSGAATTGGEASSRLYDVASGIRADGTRVIAMTVRSR